MAISKKDRFEIFKRDGFKCGYCGQTPPDVVLEIDHIEPVSKGGSDDIWNLITAWYAFKYFCGICWNKIKDGGLN